MAIIRTVPTRKIVNGFEVNTSAVAIVSDEFYSTKGEDVIIVRQIQHCKIKLDSTTTDHVKIKSLTNVLIIPDKGSIDESWDELLISNGSCVEFRFAGGNWYIMSSDGIKFD
jgi:hypothetical protein